MSKKIKSILSTTTLMTLIPSITMAAGTVTGGPASQATATGEFKFSYYFNILSAAAGLIFLVILVIGGIMYITAAGNEEASTKAKKLLVDAIIGIVVVGIAWSFGSWLGGFLGLGSLSGIK